MADKYEPAEIAKFYIRKIGAILKTPNSKFKIVIEPKLNIQKVRFYTNEINYIFKIYIFEIYIYIYYFRWILGVKIIRMKIQHRMVI